MVSKCIVDPAATSWWSGAANIFCNFLEIFRHRKRQFNSANAIMPSRFRKDDRRKLLKKISSMALCGAATALISAAIYFSMPAKAIFAP
ncbi:MAG: hypothetical protein LBB38_04370 [Puniceicoccales bacterium]|jgi:hypothetical protein|nr:hypothetical protein [Puniceicoccales bacterium]